MYGGGIYLKYLKNKCPITHLEVSQNAAYDGAGLYIEQSAVEIYHATLSNNSASNYAGAIYSSLSQ